MCYSAMIRAEHRRYMREYGVQIDIAAYVKLISRWSAGAQVKLPASMLAQFQWPQSDGEVTIKEAITNWTANEIVAVEQEIFKQRKRLADAERKLLVKVTKGAQEDVRIATAKIPWLMDKLAGLQQLPPASQDARIFPGDYAPVMVMENGQRVIKPMRFQCRLEGTPASFDRQYPGTYNARRDSLTKWWRKAFGHTHGVVVGTAFYEHVERLDKDGRPVDVVLAFEPNTHQDMLFAVVWSHWAGQQGEDDLLSFALVTDDPPPEVAAAGHDRCVIPLKPEHVDAWLDPGAHTLEALQQILDDRERPFYEHRLVA